MILTILQQEVCISDVQDGSNQIDAIEVFSILLKTLNMQYNTNLTISPIRELKRA